MSVLVPAPAPSPISSPVPGNEAERLQELNNYAVLDTPPESTFDRITRLAARFFKVPVALMSLVDRERQWFKSCYDIDVRETGRELSSCAHAGRCLSRHAVSD